MESCRENLSTFYVDTYTGYYRPFLGLSVVRVGLAEARLNKIEHRDLFPQRVNDLHCDIFRDVMVVHEATDDEDLKSVLFILNPVMVLIERKVLNFADNAADAVLHSHAIEVS